MVITFKNCGIDVLYVFYIVRIKIRDFSIQKISEQAYQISTMCNDNFNSEMVCKLTSPNLRKRKATVIAELKMRILETEETANGFKYKFNAEDNTIDQLIDFVKTERQCCDFFIFNLSIPDAGKFMWLEITGNQSVKKFIKTELEM